MLRGDDSVKREFMSFADAHGIGYFAPALECRIGAHEYVIDRRNMRAFMRSDGVFVQI